MVHIPSELPEDGQNWRIFLSYPGHHKSTNETEYFQDAVRKALRTELEKPSWADCARYCSQSLVRITQRAIDRYMLNRKANGQIHGVGWWQVANGYTAIILHDLWSSRHLKAPSNYDALYSAIRQCEANQPGLINVFNDDTLWWGMLCMHMYAIKRDRCFLGQAEVIWRHVRESICRRGQVTFEGRDMEGAVFWTTRPNEEQINAITSGLFAELSVRLALVHLTSRPRPNIIDEITAKDYIEAARCSLGWTLRCRYRPHKGIVLDHIKLKQRKAVDWIFTYNTGVAIGVCALLYEATLEAEYVILACHMAYKAMTFIGPRGWVEDNGVLTERRAYGRGTHDPLKNNDSVGFKSVLIRHLCTLYDVINRTGAHYSYPSALEVMTLIKKFINISFQSQQGRNTDGKGQYGPWWNGPFEYPTSHSQMAVLDVMAAAVLVNS